jgi:hypothetical protein
LDELFSKPSLTKAPFAPTFALRAGIAALALGLDLTWPPICGRGVLGAALKTRGSLGIDLLPARAALLLVQRKGLCARGRDAAAF